MKLLSPPASNSPRHASLAFVLLAMLVAGCQQRTSYVVIRDDSTAVVPEDSLAAEMRKAQQMWEGSGEHDAAAGVSARVVQADLSSHEPSDWPRRANYVLDSLGVGAELASGPCVIALNFFSRSDPDAGAWPYLFWCGRDHAMMQAIEGKGLRLQGLWATGVEPGRIEGVRSVAVLFIRRAPSGSQPLLMTWSMPSTESRWKLIQTLGADSLGGHGTAEFASPSDTSVDLVARTYRTPTGFAECATCPHVYTTSRFHWTPQGFVRVDMKPLASPYASFVAFIQALQSDDRAAAGQYVTDEGLLVEAERLEWNRSRGSWRPAPGSGEASPSSMTFFRGSSEAYQLQFRRNGREWLIAGIAPIERTLE